MAEKKSEECTCYWPDQVLLFPDSRAWIDEETQEFRLHNKGENKDDFLVFKFCPFCGFEMPKKPRDFVERDIPKDEFIRLLQISENIKNVDEAKRKLGEPDLECRRILYENLSDTAHVELRFGSKEIKGTTQCVDLSTTSYAMMVDVPDKEIVVTFLPKVKEDK